MNQQSLNTADANSGEYWKEGDKAVLRSGGPTMTVTSVGMAALECAWFEGDELKKEWFPPDSLDAAD